MRLPVLQLVRRQPPLAWRQSALLRVVSHVALNPRVTPRDYRQILDELQEDVLGEFAANE